MTAPDLRRLCRWLGDTGKQKSFNTLMRYILTESAPAGSEPDDAVVTQPFPRELPLSCSRPTPPVCRSSRYCPNEDHGGFGAPGFNWQNPFTAYNCTWGFHYPNTYPETQACGEGGAGVEMVERDNSTTCPRQMLCDFNTRPDGIETAKITRCNIEGYGGMDPQFKAATQWMLSQMPGGRCPYPPGDRPGILGFDKRGHYVGPQT